MFIFGGCKYCKKCWDEPEEFVEPQSLGPRERVESFGTEDGSNCAQIAQPAEPVPTPTQATAPTVVKPFQIICKSCNNKGIDLFGNPCTCEHGQKPVVATGHPSKAEPEPKVTADQPEAVLPPAEAPREDPPGNKSLLGPTNRIFIEALSLGSDSRVVSMKRCKFVEGLENFTGILDQMGGGMGSYLETNTKKLRNSKASASEEDYRAWMRSELPVHAAAGYKGYVDDSAWMANLWIWWTLEFFVEFFAAIIESTSSMKICAEEVHKKTLYNHQNFFQRTAFTTAMKKLPDSNAIIAKFQGDGTSDDVLRDVATFVSLGRPLVSYLGELNGEVDYLMQSEKKAKSK
jgi:hypothetical protein